MSPLNIDGKKYFSEDELKKEDEKVDEKVDEKEDEEKEEEEETLDEKVDDAAEKIMAKIDPERIKAQILKDLKKDMEVKDKKISDLVDLEKLMKKDVSEMTAKEKILGFFQAMIRNDKTVLKALVR